MVAVVAKAQAVHEAIRSSMPEFPMAVTNYDVRRGQLFATSFHLNHDLHGSIIRLISAGGSCDGGAFALLRPLVESFVKGMWLFYCASARNERTHWLTRASTFRSGQ